MSKSSWWPRNVVAAAGAIAVLGTVGLAGPARANDRLIDTDQIHIQEQGGACSRMCIDYYCTTGILAPHASNTIGKVTVSIEVPLADRLVAENVRLVAELERTRSVIRAQGKLSALWAQPPKASADRPESEFWQ